MVTQAMNCLNSTMVRFKLEFAGFDSPQGSMSQFHYGSIQIMIQADKITECKKWSQFHYGSIQIIGMMQGNTV